LEVEKTMAIPAGFYGKIRLEYQLRKGVPGWYLFLLAHPLRQGSVNIFG
jgi:hypothetical protein